MFCNNKCVRATHTRQLLVSKLYSYQQPEWLASDGSGGLSCFHKGRVESTVSHNVSRMTVRAIGGDAKGCESLSDGNRERATKQGLRDESEVRETSCATKTATKRDER